jgi:hypothetical protein
MHPVGRPHSVQSGIVRGGGRRNRTYSTGHRMPFRGLPSITKYHNRKPQILTPEVMFQYPFHQEWTLVFYVIFSYSLNNFKVSSSQLFL